MSAGEKLGRLMRWLSRLATLVMLGVLGWLGAEIYWKLSAPEGTNPGVEMESEPQRAAQSVVNRHLFGKYIAVAAAAAAPSNYKLNGVIAAQKPGQRAFALITEEGKAAQLVREGEEIAPGVKLVRVLARQVELLRGGQTQTLDLLDKSKAAEIGKPLAGGSGVTLQNPKANEIPPTPAAVPAALVAAVPETDQAAAKAQAPPAPPAVAVAQPQSGPTQPRRSRNRRSSEDE